MRQPLILLPYYQNACFDGLLAYLKGIGQATSLPLILYTRDWFNLNAEEAQRVADEVPTLWGWKDGQGEFEVFATNTPPVSVSDSPGLEASAMIT